MNFPNRWILLVLTKTYWPPLEPAVELRVSCEGPAPQRAAIHCHSWDRGARAEPRGWHTEVSVRLLASWCCTVTPGAEGVPLRHPELLESQSSWGRGDLRPIHISLRGVPRLQEETWGSHDHFPGTCPDLASHVLSWWQFFFLPEAWWKHTIEMRLNTS